MSRSSLLLGALTLSALGATIAACGDSFTTGGAGATTSSTTDTTTTSSGGGNGGDGTGGSTTSTTSSEGGSDPACKGDERCIPPVPANWNGPATLYIGNSPPAGCDSDFEGPIPGFAGPIIADPVTCHGCGCGAPTGVTCGPPSIELHTLPACAVAATDFVGQAPGAANTCTPIPNNLPAVSGRMTALGEPASGSCTPNGGGVASTPVASWSAQAGLCQAKALGNACGGGGNKTCAPVPSGAYSNYCIAKGGADVMCPGAYANKIVFYGSMQDNRTCSACTCGGPAGGSCSSSVTMYTNNTCNSLNATMTSSACVDGTATWGGLKWSSTVGNGGSCPTGGGQPTGEVLAMEPLTVCCIDPIPVPN